MAFAPQAEAARRHHYRHAVSFAGLTDPSKDAALVVDGETGKVLYARNENALRHPASLTKMMTLYLLFDALKKGQVSFATEMPVSAHAAAQKPTNLHLTRGEQISVDKAIKAIVVRSANDVAVVIAEYLGGTEPHFAELMNAKARALGMKDTFYHNASGLPDPLQITTATDLALLARHLAYDFPQYFHYFSTPGFSFHGTEYVTHDNLLGRYQGTDGIKTGYTGASGFNLVSSVVRDNVHVIGVVMGGITAQRRDREMMHLLDQTFAQIAQQPMLVAHNNVPWRAVAMNTTPNYSGVLANSGAVVALPPSNGVVTDSDDEDAAESRPDAEYAGETAVPTPAPQAAPAITPSPRPSALVASYQPKPAIAPAAVKPALRPIIGEGDVGDAGTATPSLGLHDWTIQIGAFADLTLARTQLADYAERSMDILGQAQRIVVPFQSTDGHTLYRARFGPFLEREARQICARLTERGQTCFAAISTR